MFTYTRGVGKKSCSCLPFFFSSPSAFVRRCAVSYVEESAHGAVVCPVFGEAVLLYVLACLVQAAERVFGLGLAPTGLVPVGTGQRTGKSGARLVGVS